MQRVGNAVIAAAGLGSRLGLGLPKCMLEIDGKTLISRVIEELALVVQRIYVVVGYREELVLTHLRRHHPRAIAVRNSEFRTTNTAQSMAMARPYLRGKTVFLDGDLIFAPGSLSDFVAAAADTSRLVGVTPATTDQAVYVATASTAEGLQVTNFSRTSRSSLEWANVFVAPPEVIAGTSGYVYEALQKHLPLAARRIELAEVDTEQDLARAWKFAVHHRPR